MRRVSKRVREEAIEVLECCHGSDACLSELLLGNGAVWRLAFDARHEVHLAARAAGLTLDTGASREGSEEYDGACLEAAALLRDGWTPGEKVRRLQGAK